MSRLRVCVLISGSGSNLQALIDARAQDRLDIDIVHVISNVTGAPGLARACRAGIPASVLEHGRFENRDDFDQALAVLMEAGQPDLIVFAGFMRVVGEPVLNRHVGRMINLHPSLLPRYPGLDTYRRAIEADDTVHGASLHFLTAELDGGPVIAQRRIPILPSDDVKALAGRLAPEEHRLVVATVELFARHTVELHNDRVLIDGAPLAAPLQLGENGTLHNQ